MRKSVLITGGSRGIGAATARLLASRGYDLCISYREREATAEALLDELRAFGVKAIAARADIASEADVEALFAAVDSHFGQLDALVNNAGMLLPQTRAENMTAARINKILHTNVTGTLLCCREAIKRMSTKHGGSGGAIVNVSSMAARTGSPHEYIDYAASKGAVDSMTIGLARELAEDGIRVNGVRPGPIHTEMHADGGEPDRIERVRAKIPLGRGGQPEEVAAAIAWLLSEEASFVSGSFIDVAGGA
ncbi:NAD(P)-dependent dehydrogenase, short-chain alcohol dehydrogenase family [Microbulbifer donghaiensis]|uniref:NAD(P)-dependent dehydrogenase, short-chain alcohol dehydrogenase family n=1 Tax=Microbulbifer donghaiensis TaxID=494016 RepID=A0A1M5EPI3_9GAMM|nr:SDR family oxidoreductase [Microbulbifer donghaiensis]SHF81054.1 NAD(P)-dependent dehydrogenase, short-chain alcohol dehydrogenase family [Microbulbifer donghaiensis]